MTPTTDKPLRGPAILKAENERLRQQVKVLTQALREERQTVTVLRAELRRSVLSGPGGILTRAKRLRLSPVPFVNSTSAAPSPVARSSTASSAKASPKMKWRHGGPRVWAESAPRQAYIEFRQDMDRLYAERGHGGSMRAFIAEICRDATEVVPRKSIKQEADRLYRDWVQGGRLLRGVSKSA